jgi:ribosomal protein S10
MLVDKSAEKIVKTVKVPVQLWDQSIANSQKLFTVLRSPHVNKKS